MQTCLLLNKLSRPREVDRSPAVIVYWGENIQNFKLLTLQKNFYYVIVSEADMSRSAPYKKLKNSFLDI